MGSGVAAVLPLMLDTIMLCLLVHGFPVLCPVTPAHTRSKSASSNTM